VVAVIGLAKKLKCTLDVPVRAYPRQRLFPCTSSFAREVDLL